MVAILEITSWIQKSRDHININKVVFGEIDMKARS